MAASQVVIKSLTPSNSFPPAILIILRLTDPIVSFNGTEAPENNRERCLKQKARIHRSRPCPRRAGHRCVRVAGPAEGIWGIAKFQRSLTGVRCKVPYPAITVSLDSQITQRGPSLSTETFPRTGGRHQGLGLLSRCHGTPPWHLRTSTGCQGCFRKITLKTMGLSLSRSSS